MRAVYRCAKQSAYTYQFYEWRDYDHNKEMFIAFNCNLAKECASFVKRRKNTKWTTTKQTTEDRLTIKCCYRTIYCICLSLRHVRLDPHSNFLQWQFYKRILFWRHRKHIKPEIKHPNGKIANVINLRKHKIKPIQFILFVVLRII